MSRFHKAWQRWTAVGVFIFVGTATGAWLNDQDYYQEVRRGMRLFGDVYKNLTEKYVEEITPHDVLRSGIDGMLSSLDPYTAYYEDEESSDLDVIMMGKYGGVGISVGIKNGYITVISTMDHSPGQRAGILPGDRIMAVDGLTSKQLKLKEMSYYVKGEPGTKLRLTIQREGEPHPFDVELVREMIAVENIAFSGLLDPQVGYIKLTKFSKTAPADFLSAVRSLKSLGMKALVLDLRGNPGGLLDAAIEITNHFVKKGQLITYTKGRAPEATRYYTAESDPLFPDLPLVVLVDKGSASASEIVSGALQDLDRAVIIGSTTFGKGLVQTLYPLSDRDAVMKITTAKYFTPSGRCIQKEVYKGGYHRHVPADDEEALTDDTFGLGDTMETEPVRLSDTVKVTFKTNGGRIVYANGGITPDVVVPDKPAPLYFSEILKSGLIFDYATSYMASHKQEDSVFSVTDSVLVDFRQYLQKRHFTYRSAVDKELEQAGIYAQKSGYSRAFVDAIRNLRNDLASEKEHDFLTSREFIRTTLEQEIVSRYHGNRSRLITMLRQDAAYAEALKVLQDRERYKVILAGR